MTNLQKRAFVLAMFIVGPTSASAMYVPQDVQQIPLARLSRNLRVAIDREPRNPTYIVNLARAHAMAWSLRSDSVPAVVSESQGFLPSRNGERVAGKPIEPMTVWFGYEASVVPFKFVVPTLVPKRLEIARAHFDSALALYQTALALDSANVSARLGRAWLLTHTTDTGRAIAELRRVIRESAPATSPPTRQFDSRLSAEAAGYLIPLLNPSRDGIEVAALRNIIAVEIEQAKMRPVTPIAIPLRDGLTANAISFQTASVSFDADGSGIHRRWSWIRPNAAWLVHDPQHRGRITSALQMFGSVSFWMFWNNGYEALSSLDDNHDRQLTGHELDGLALWRDANGNGVSDAGEVRTLAQYGIVALSCNSKRDAGNTAVTAYSPAGVTFRNGTKRPSYDLVLQQRASILAARR